MLEVLADEAARLAAGRLQPACASFYQPAMGPCRLRLLLLHGFSAGPWQWRPLAAALAARGVASWAPRLPGHGDCTPDGQEDAGGLPSLGQASLYAAAGRRALAALAPGEGATPPIGVMGLSLGGAIACDLLMADAAAPRPQLCLAALVAPLLAAASWRQRRLLAAVRLAGRAGGQRVRDRLDAHPFSWRGAEGAAGSAWRRPGHSTFGLGRLLAAVDYAHGVRLSLRPLTVPCQLVLSGADLRIHARAVVTWLRRSRAPHGVWRFPRAQQVPHAMLTAEENPDAASRATLEALLGDFALSRQPRHR